MKPFPSETLVRLDGEAGFVVCSKAGDVTVMVAGQRTVVPSDDVDDRIVVDEERTAKLAEVNHQLAEATKAYESLRESKKRIITGL